MNATCRPSGLKLGDVFSQSLALSNLSWAQLNGGDAEGAVKRIRHVVTGQVSSIDVKRRRCAAGYVARTRGQPDDCQQVRRCFAHQREKTVPRGTSSRRTLLSPAGPRSPAKPCKSALLEVRRVGRLDWAGFG